MKKAVKTALLLCAAVICAAALWGNQEVHAAEEQPKAVGVVLVNDEEKLPDIPKIYAHIREGEARFDLDAACAYYVEKDAESGYAGQQNFSRLSFRADCDTNKIGAEGVVSFRKIEGHKNTVSAYYLYEDEKGLFFDPSAPFTSVMAGGEIPVTGKDFDCSVSVETALPAQRFTLSCYNDQGTLIAEKEYAEKEVEDEQRFELAEGTHHVIVTAFSSDGTLIHRVTVTQEDRYPYICFRQDGQILGSKVLNLAWAL